MCWAPSGALRVFSLSSERANLIAGEGLPPHPARLVLAAIGGFRGVVDERSDITGPQSWECSGGIFSRSEAPPLLVADLPDLARERAVGVGRRRDEERAAQIASTACRGARRPRGRRRTAARTCWLQLGAPARWYLISLTPRACDGRGSVGRSLGVRTAGPPERRRRRRPRRRRGQFQTQAPTWG